MKQKKIVQAVFIGLLLMVAFILAMATFIENDHGAQTAWALIYDAIGFKVFILLILLFILFMFFFNKINIKKNWALLLLFISIFIIVVSGFVTRHVGYEGVMHIREGKVQNQFVSNLAYLQCQAISDDDSSSWEKPLLLSSITENKFSKTLELNGDAHQIQLLDFKTNVINQLQENNNGTPVIKLQISSENKTEFILLEDAEIFRLYDYQIGFNVSFDSASHCVHIRSQNESLFLDSHLPVQVHEMMNPDITEIAAHHKIPLEKKKIYKTPAFDFALSEYYQRGSIVAVEDDIRGTQDAICVQFDNRKIWFLGSSGIENNGRQFKIDGQKFHLTYGAKQLEIPFRIKLHDFILKTYDGSNQPSSFISQVEVIDQDTSFTYDIYMNHTLTYRGYRFFQSSYDHDQMGTYLSVKYDPGTPVVYFGYTLLVLVMLILLIWRKSPIRLRRFSMNLQPIILLILGFAMFMPAQLKSADIQDAMPPKSHGQLFGELIMQGIDGRLKPMNTLSHEILSKVFGEHCFQNYHPNQVVLGMVMFPYEWQKVPMIKLGDTQINLLLDLPKSQTYAAYSDFFYKESRQYKLQEFSQQASSKMSSERSQKDKAILKVEERLNICYAIYSGRLFRIFPDKKMQNAWLILRDILYTEDEQLLEIHKIFNNYMDTVQAYEWQKADTILNQIIQYQIEKGHVSLSQSKFKAEINFYEWQIFEKLMPIYMVLGTLILIIAILSLFCSSFSKSWLVYSLKSLMGLLLLLHAYGLGLRWYISGHAPWSNGYESMIYLAWTILFAGFILNRKQPFVIGGTFLISGFILLVAHLSWMDPQITQLVPILKSYWLTLHVSVIMSSYGFLTLSAILSWMVLILIAFLSLKNKIQMVTVIESLTYLIKSGLQIGLFCLILGTILGSVWANESWGRYWGWDPKETWTLISILVYTALIYYFSNEKPSLYLFHLFSVLSISTILMTYFGVNYYLTGLHSYAGGDAFTIPSWIWIVIVSYIITGLFAYRNRKLIKMETA